MFWKFLKISQLLECSEKYMFKKKRKFPINQKFEKKTCFSKPRTPTQKIEKSDLATEKTRF